MPSVRSWFAKHGLKLIDTWRGSSVTSLPGHDPRGNRSSLSQICSRAELMKRVEACSSRKFTGRILGIGESFRLMPAEASFLAIVPTDLHPNKKRRNGFDKNRVERTGELERGKARKFEIWSGTTSDRNKK